MDPFDNFIPGVVSNGCGLVLPNDGTLSIISSDTNVLSIDVNKKISIASDTTVIGKLSLPNHPLESTHGGTGNNNYSIGDILVANSSNSLVKLTKPAQNNLLLITNDASPLGISWSQSTTIVASGTLGFSTVITDSPSLYTIPSLNAYNDTNSGTIILGSTDINLLTYGINGLARSDTLTGTISPRSLTTNITGNGTLFTRDLRVGDSFQCGPENRTVETIISDTSLTIGSPFTLLNQWTLTGTAVQSTTKFKFGTQSLSAPNNGDYASLIIGSSFTFLATNPWTIEFFINMTSVSSNRTLMASNNGVNGFMLAFTQSTKNFTISLSSNGVSYDIANATTINFVVNNSTWYHLAAVYTGSMYKIYVNGGLSLTISSSTPIIQSGLAQFKVGGDATTVSNSYIDELRISNIARYTNTFTPTTSAFTLDSNTISLNHFEQSTVNDSDDAIAGTFQYNRGGIANKKNLLLVCSKPSN